MLRGKLMHILHKRKYQLDQRFKHEWRGCGEKGTFLPCLWEYKLVQPLWRTVWRSLKKLKIELPYDPANSLLGIYPDKTNWK